MHCFGKHDNRGCACCHLEIRLILGHLRFRMKTAITSRIARFIESLQKGRNSQVRGREPSALTSTTLSELSRSRSTILQIAMVGFTACRKFFVLFCSATGQLGGGMEGVWLTHKTTTLQLNVYKYMLESENNLRVNAMFLGQVHPSLERARLIRVPCMREELELIVTDQLAR